MPTVIAHAALAAGAFRFVDRGRHPGWKGPLLAASLSALPDIDVVWWSLTSYGAPWGHRGMTHSLTFAVIAGVIAAFAVRRRISLTGGVWPTALFLALATASHGFLDALTNGGRGIAFFGPFDNERYFLPVQPIPVSPITVDLTNPWLWRVFASEALLFGPAAWALGTWWTFRSRWARAAAVAGLLASAVFWGIRIAG